jgi:chemotaxis response regulator CheB
MPIRVLIADDSDVMLAAMRRVIEEEPSLEVVGQASSFAKAMQMVADLKPDVLVLDLRMPERGDFGPVLVRSQLAAVSHVLAVSISNDAEAKALSESYGAEILLDKMNLYSELVPEILQRHSQWKFDRENALQPTDKSGRPSVHQNP